VLAETYKAGHSAKGFSTRKAQFQLFRHASLASFEDLLL
jgi:hypothetical protein